MNTKEPKSPWRHLLARRQLIPRIGSMVRPRHLLFLSLAATLVVLAVAMWLFWPRTAITRENAAKIREGMMLADVEEILGGPSRDELSGPHKVQWSYTNLIMVVNRKEWIGPDIAVSVAFRHNRVVSNEVTETYFPEESPIQRIRRWLRL
jgi:outer membrane protein assembly factor BamE (lipoprotein component of BamABCDE complex)